MLIELSSKYAVSVVVRFIGDEGVIQVARICMGRKKRLSGRSFCCYDTFFSLLECAYLMFAIDK